MTYKEFNTFCSTQRASSYVMQWGGAHVWKVGEKVFAIGGWERDNDPAYTFKVSEFDFELLKDESGFRPAPYMASRGMKWIQQYKVSGCEDSQLRFYLKESYRIVSLGLTKKRQKELGLNQV